MNEINSVNVKRIDFHSHILPAIDDGAKDVEMSLKLLKMLKEDGVNTVVATPHLYLHRESADEFIARRNMSVKILKDAISKNDYPEIIVGAEVYYTPALLEIPNETIKKLCIENTDYLLLELPYQNISSSFLNLLSDFINFSSCRTILAHLERYIDFFSANDLNDFISNGILAQFNCDSLEKSFEKRRTLKMIKNGFLHIMGTDAHHPEKRPPLFKNAEQILRKKLSDGEFVKIMETAEAVLRNEIIF